VSCAAVPPLMAAGIQGHGSCAGRRGTWPTAGAHAGGGFGGGRRLACGAALEASGSGGGGRGK
jgi:hypothetical protein